VVSLADLLTDEACHFRRVQIRVGSCVLAKAGPVGAVQVDAALGRADLAAGGEVRGAVELLRGPAVPSLAAVGAEAGDGVFAAVALCQNTRF
jgi:hypothetical protein